MEPMILASGSLQRQEYLRLLGLPFSIMPSQADETLERSFSPREAAEDIARRKVNEVLGLLAAQHPPWILGADTLISMDGSIFGKPKDREDAACMLSRFQGRQHEVITGLCLYNRREKTLDCRSVSSSVTFSPLTQPEIDWYLDTGEWQGVAGAYKIQGLAACFVDGIKGSYSSIVGLPLHEFYVMLKDNGYPYGDAALPTA